MNTYDLMEECLADPGSIPSSALHTDWRIRYAAAVAIGRSKDPRWLPLLKEMLRIEDDRPLYSQPRVQYINSTDDTRMAEQIGPIKAVFDQEYDDFHKEAWRCRGRVKQAVLFALFEIGLKYGEVCVILQRYLEDPGEDYAVKAAAARAIGVVGGVESIPALEAARKFDEWCTQTEAAKAIRRIQYAPSA